jgi:phosphatidate cytidylyltransferase
MRQRIITAIFFGAAMLAGVYGGKYTFFCLFFIVSTGSLWELSGLLFSPDEKFFTLRRMFTLLVGVLPFVLYACITLQEPTTITSQDQLCDAFQISKEQIIAIIAGLEILLIFLLFVFELFTESARPFPNIGTYLLGIFYIGIPMTLLIETAFWTGAYGPHRVFGIMWLVWTNDSMAYFIGSKLGKNKFFPRISPKKTWEGTIGGLICTVLMAFLLSSFIDEYTTPQWLGIGVVVGIIGTLGDLVESMLKRSVNVKDSGTLLPGHGGLLDRFDSYLFVQPFIWALLLLI